jgi:transcriptional regulator with XRE-family HTH domain
MQMTADTGPPNRMISTDTSDGDLIRAAREDRGWTQTQLAAQLSEHGYRHKLGQSGIANYENGYREVPRLLRTHLQQVLGITLPRRPPPAKRGRTA